jgi:DNA-binding LytR/AlgR family response regulator
MVVNEALQLPPLRCMVVDDDPIAGQIIATYIGRDKRLLLVGVYERPDEALVGLAQTPIDVLFLDIEMPTMSGIELLGSLVQKPHVIFTTARREFAANAFDLHATDYLVKPISFERFLQSIHKAITAQTALASRNTAHTVSHSSSSNDAASSGEYLWLKTSGTLIKIPFAEILYIEAEADYINVVTDTGRFMTLQSLKNAEEKLDAALFCRVHRSFIVALPRIDAIEGNMIRVGAHTIPLGRQYRDALFERISRDKHL